MALGGGTLSMVAASPARSALFVPANRADMLDKAPRFGPDIVLADLEDAVPDSDKGSARKILLSWLEGLPDDTAHIAVRINGLDRDMLDADLAVCVHPRVETVMLPKIHGPAEVEKTAQALEHHEDSSARRHGVFIWPIVETAAAVRTAYDIARSSPRVRYMGGSAGDEGDLAREIGFRWTPSFQESLFIRSKVLVDARAAGIENPMTGVVTNLSDPGEFQAFATQSRDLGYAGMMVIHPSHVPIVNSVFGVTPERLAWANGVIEALDAAGSSGVGAIRYGGAMVDVAMVQTAREVLGMAEAFGR
ncbi:MAG: HpcH/HpaI aldolase/citrate lyase family protein [Acidimicrobiales bacterium]